MRSDLAAFLNKFSHHWGKGYFEGDPLDPMSPSSYGIYGYGSILYNVYSSCIRPYVTAETTTLEIGPGRGAWTKAILQRGCHKIYAIDAAPPEHTGFWEYVGKNDRVQYIVAKDFLLSEVPDRSIDFFFSFGVFCHLTPEMCTSYIASLGAKLKPGARGFLMIADFDKYTACLDAHDSTSIERILADRRGKIWRPIKWTYALTWYFFRSKMDLDPVDRIRSKSADGAGDVGWYDWGLETACAVLEREGFDIVDRDLNVVPRDPVIHFVKR